jgi:hypothetical protein
VIVYVGNGGIFLLVSAGEVDFTIEGAINRHVLEYVLVGGFELIEPLQDVAFDHKQTVEHLHGFGQTILRPF